MATKKDTKSRAKSVLGGKKKKKSGKVKEMHIRKAANGGFIARHDYHPSEPDQAGQSVTPPSDEHAIPGMDELQQHVSSNMSGPLQQPTQPTPMPGGMQ